MTLLGLLITFGFALTAIAIKHIAKVIGRYDAIIAVQQEQIKDLQGEVESLKNNTTGQSSS